MRRFGRRFGRRFKRSVNWIPGFGMVDEVGCKNFKSFVWGQVGTSCVYMQATVLTASDDIRSHGGEDCVFAGLRYQLLPFSARDVGPVLAARPIVMIIALCDCDPTDAIIGKSYLNSDGLGSDNILHTRYMFASAKNGYSQLDDGGFGDQFYVGRVKAQRKISDRSKVFCIFQTIKEGVATPLDFAMIGNMRMLLKRPR